MVDSTNLPEVDINQIATDLNGKADRDYTNCTYTPMRSDVVHIVETYSSGTSWYKIWSADSTGYRWCEQGGYTPRTSDAYISVLFLKPFINANPNVQFTRRFYYDNDSTACQNRTTGVSSVSTTGFKCYDNGWSASGGSAGVWRACGYIN